MCMSTPTNGIMNITLCSVNLQQLEGFQSNNLLYLISIFLSIGPRHYLMLTLSAEVLHCQSVAFDNDIVYLIF
jgi:hypothetical protein